MARTTFLLTLLASLPLINSIVLPAALSTKTNDEDDTPLPLVIWHGLGDNYAADGLASVAELAEDTNPGTFVYIIRLDEDPSKDRSATFCKSHCSIASIVLHIRKSPKSCFFTIDVLGVPEYTFCETLS